MFFTVQGKNMIANYHTHTYRCGHGIGTEKEYIEAAIQAGIRILGFSEHAPYWFGDTGHYSRFRMPVHDGENYVNTLLSLRKEYANDIEIFIGFEAEYYPLFFQGFLEKICPLAYDYLILGQHFTGNEIGEIYTGTPSPGGKERLQTYVNQCLEGMKTGKFSYLAHPDLIQTNVKSSVLRGELVRLCQGVKELGYPVEINFLGMRDHRAYPTVELYQAAAETGCDVIFGVDAHSPDVFLDQNTLKRARKIVNAYGLHLVKTLQIRNAEEEMPKKCHRMNNHDNAPYNASACNE